MTVIKGSKAFILSIFIKSFERTRLCTQSALLVILGSRERHSGPGDSAALEILRSRPEFSHAFKDEERDQEGRFLFNADRDNARIQQYLINSLEFDLQCFISHAL